MSFNRSKFFNLPALAASARESKYVLPYSIGALFGGAAGTAILQPAQSVESAIDLAIVMVILLMICGLVDLGRALVRLLSNHGALSAQPNS